MQKATCFQFFNPTPIMLQIGFLKQRHIYVSCLLEDITDGTPMIQFFLGHAKPFTSSPFPIDPLFSHPTPHNAHSHKHTHPSHTYLLLKHSLYCPVSEIFSQVVLPGRSSPLLFLFSFSMSLSMSYLFF